MKKICLLKIGEYWLEFERLRLTASYINYYYIS